MLYNGQHFKPVNRLSRCNPHAILVGCTKLDNYECEIDIKPCGLDNGTYSYEPAALYNYHKCCHSL